MLFWRRALGLVGLFAHGLVALFSRRRLLRLILRFPRRRFLRWVPLFTSSRGAIRVLRRGPIRFFLLGKFATGLAFAFRFRALRGSPLLSGLGLFLLSSPRITVRSGILSLARF